MSIHNGATALSAAAFGGAGSGESVFPPPLSILGVSVVPFESYSQAVACVEEAVAARRKTFCVAINPEKVYRAMNDPRLMAALGEADFGICDGIGIVLAAKVLHRQHIGRCTGCNLFFHLVARGEEAGWRIFMLGASAASNERACAELRRRHPGLRIVGRRDGFFEDSAEVVRQINASEADVLFVAMGSPKQEFWIAEHRGEIQAPFCMGVGGTFDVISGVAKRAPRFFCETGTEFVYRLLCNPWRWRRQLALPLFMMKVAVARVAWFGPREKRVADTQ